MKLFALLLLFIQFSVHATVLVVPDVFRVLSVNETPVKKTLFVTETALSFSPGRQVLVLQYADIFDNELHDDHTKVSSEPFVVSFSLQQQSKLTFVRPKLDDLKSALQYAQAPKIEILDEYGNPLELVHSLGQSEGVNERFVKNTDPSKDMTSQNKGQTRQANAPDSFEMLKFWWLNASEEDKKRFQAYIKTKEG